VNYGRALEDVPVMNCDDHWENERFHVAISAHMETKLFDADESIVVDGMHIMLEGLVILGGMLLRKGKMFGVTVLIAGINNWDQQLCFQRKIETAVALTFTAAIYACSEDLRDILATGRYPTFARQMKQEAVRTRFKNLVAMWLHKTRWWQARSWSKESKQRYKKAVMTLRSAKPATSLVCYVLRQALCTICLCPCIHYRSRIRALTLHTQNRLRRRRETGSTAGHS
jgi:hypothetical protein